MKKIFSTLILLIALLSGANAQAPVIEGSSYYLPKTALQFTVLVEKRVCRELCFGKNWFSGPLPSEELPKTPGPEGHHRRSSLPE